MAGRDGGEAVRVAFVTHYTAMYGANRSLLALVEGLRPLGVEPRVLSPGRGPVTDELEAMGVPVRAIGFRRWRTQGRRGASLRLAGNLVVLPAVARQLRGWGVDLVYTNSSVVPVGIWAAELLGLPHVWHVREFGRADYGLTHDWGASFFGYWMRRSDAVVAVSEALRRHLAPDLGREVRVVYNGVVTRQRARELRDRAAESAAGTGPEGEASGPYAFVIVGTLGGRKGQAEAIDALALVRERGLDARLRIVGSGPGGERERLERRASERGVGGRVEFPGFVSDPFEEYMAADAVLVCSRKEAMGRVTAEAMFACRPVVGYRGGATPELVADGETGLLYEDGAEGLADAMAELARRPELGRRMGREGWGKAFPELTVEEYAGRIHRLVERTALGSAPGAPDAEEGGR